MALRVLGTYGTIIVLVIMLVVFSIVAPRTFATFGNFRNILNDMAIGTIVAAGLTVPLVAGDFDLSIGYVASFCGLLVVGILSAGLLPIPLAIITVMGVGTAIGVVNGLIVSKIGVNAFIATLGTGTVVVAAGGGGIPVVRESDGRRFGIQAVIDKDLTSALLGRALAFDHLLILTAVSRVAIRFRKPAERWLDTVMMQLALGDGGTTLPAG